jgi:hypothetical protein
VDDQSRRRSIERGLIFRKPPLEISNIAATALDAAPALAHFTVLY